MITLTSTNILACYKLDVFLQYHLDFSLILLLSSRSLTRQFPSFSSKVVYVISQWDCKMDVSEITS